MSRAQFMDDAYFEEYISTQQNRIVKFSETLQSIDNSQYDKIIQCKKYLIVLYKNLLSAEYSAGKEKKQLQETFLKYLKLQNEVTVSNYAELTDTLALTILFECPETECSNLLATSQFEDSLTKKLKEYVRTGRYTIQNGTLNYPEHYQIFEDYLNQDVHLQNFIDYMEYQWYSSCQNFSFYDAHKSNAKVYIGYWCWLAAAILKMNSEKNIHSLYIPDISIF